MLIKRPPLLFITFGLFTATLLVSAAGAATKAKTQQNSHHARSVELKGQIQLSDQQALEIGQRIWRNECEGTITGLTAWNHGEDFASLGIGHFIWYPAGKTGPFSESFPALLSFLKSHKIKLPRWLSRARCCPWPDRQAFMKDFSGTKMKELRKILAETVAFQARFAALRLEGALAKILAAAPRNDQERIRSRFYQVASQPVGLYALMDYVNFKGEGISPTERYRDQGWGLLQVLQEMGEGPPLVEFARAAALVLTRRVANSPPERNESRWLAGWRKRCESYAR